MQLDVANARFRERRTERALVTPGRLHADKRRPRPRDPRRKGLRGVRTDAAHPAQSLGEAIKLPIAGDVALDRLLDGVKALGQRHR